MTPSPFEVLGVAPTATDAEIKAAYRRLVALFHPDNNPGFPVEATQRVREINEAYAQARAGWRPPAGVTAGPVPPSPHRNPPRRWDPPTPSPRPKGPQPPPPKYDDVPPPRSGPPKERPSAAGDERARRAALAADLVIVGFFASAADAARQHTVVDAFLPLFAGDARLRSCSRYESLATSGPRGLAAHHHGHFLHAVPSLAVGGIQARSEAIDRIAPAQFVACTADALMWSVSAYADGDGILLQENINVFTAPFDHVEDVHRSRGQVVVSVLDGPRLQFGLGKAAAAKLAAAIVAGA